MPKPKKTKSGPKTGPSWRKIALSRLKTGLSSLKAALSSVKAALSWTGAKIAAGFARVKKFLIARRNAIKDFFSVLWDLPYISELSRFTLALRRNLIALCGVILFLLLFDIEINFRNIFGLKIKGLAEWKIYMTALAIVFYFFAHYFYSLISELHKLRLAFAFVENKDIRRDWGEAHRKGRISYSAKRAQKTEFWLFNIDLPLLLSVGAMIWLGVEIYHGWR